MMLKREEIELLLDLLENKLSSMEVTDKEDKKSLEDIKTCREELRRMQGSN